MFIKKVLVRTACTSVAIICLLLGFCAAVKMAADTREKELSTWLGKYSFDECCGGGDDPFMMMLYDLEIYKENNRYYGRLEVMGQTTWIVAKVFVRGDSEQIDLVFIENLMNEQGFIHDDRLEDVLFSLKRIDDKMYTYWGDIPPLLWGNEKPGEYFEKYFDGLSPVLRNLFQEIQ